MNLQDLELIIKKVESLKVEVYRLTDEEIEGFELEFQNARQSISLLKRDLSDISRAFSKTEKAD